jgi:hypothetical protein
MKSDQAVVPTAAASDPRHYNVVMPTQVGIHVFPPGQQQIRGGRAFARHDGETPTIDAADHLARLLPAAIADYRQAIDP